ncbi:hypothetical protein OF83DRAFT_1159596, partial [Amylostereum chailletii]
MGWALCSRFRLFFVFTRPSLSLSFFPSPPLVPSSRLSFPPMFMFMFPLPLLFSSLLFSSLRPCQYYVVDRCVSVSVSVSVSLSPPFLVLPIAI